MTFDTLTFWLIEVNRDFKFEMKSFSSVLLFCFVFYKKKPCLKRTKTSFDLLYRKLCCTAPTPYLCLIHLFCIGVWRYNWVLSWNGDNLESILCFGWWQVYCVCSKPTCPISNQADHLVEEGTIQSNSRWWDKSLVGDC